MHNFLLGIAFFALNVSVMALPVEWGFEADAQYGRSLHFEEQLFLRDDANSEMAATIDGIRAVTLFNLEGFYQNFGLGFQPRFYLAARGDYQFQLADGQVTDSRSGVDFSRVQSYQFLLKYRFFSYGDRPLFIVKGGYLVRSVGNFSAFTSPLADLDSDFTNRFFIVGFTYEPVIYSFRRFELSIPIDFNFGLGHISGSHLLVGLTDKKQYMAEGSIGLRVFYEPRGPYALARLSLAGFRQPFERGFSQTEVGQTEIFLMAGAGYYFKSTVYNRVE